MKTLPFKSNIFNTVFCNGVIEHQLELQTILKEIRRIMRYENLFITTISTECFKDYLFFHLLVLRFNKIGLKRIAKILAKLER